LPAANSNRFWGIFWVDVNTPSLAQSTFIDIAKMIGFSADSLKDALRVLENTKKSWLLILDNADDPNFDYQEYLPSGTHGAIIMTSRISECSRYNTVGLEALTGLDIEHSKELLLKAADIHQDLWPSNDRQAEEVVNLLGSHTLALIQAGAYIATGHSQFEQYPEVYQRQRKRLLEYKPKQGQSRYCNVYATFEASADILERSNDEVAKDALRLLKVLSMLSSGSLPIQFFEEAWKGCRKILRTAATETIDSLSRWHVSRLPEFMSTDVDIWDAYRLIEASSLLSSLSLVTKDSSSGLSMHPLTHAWAKDRQGSEQQGLSWTAAGCILTLSRSGSTLWQSQERRLRPHIQSYLDIKIETAFLFGPMDMIIPIFLQCGWTLLRMRDDSRLGDLLQDLFIKLSIDQNIPSQEYLPIYGLEARSLVDRGLNKEAVKLLEQIVEIQGTTLAEDHLCRLASQHELAAAYQANGQVKEAVKLLEQVVEIQGKTLAEDHPSRLTSQHALAGAYEANGQVKEAVKILEQVVEIEETTLAEDHPDRLASQHALAIAYQANRQVKEAVKLLEQVVEIQGTTLAEDHPSRLTSQHALARAYQANGQVKEAVKLLEQVVEIQGMTLAEDHPDRLAAEGRLAYCLKQV
jgi:tetratricopeptide (TPR) repeat protein